MMLQMVSRRPCAATSASPEISDLRLCVYVCVFVIAYHIYHHMNAIDRQAYHAQTRSPAPSELSGQERTASGTPHRAARRRLHICVIGSSCWTGMHGRMRHMRHRSPYTNIASLSTPFPCLSVCRTVCFLTDSTNSRHLAMAIDDARTHD